MAKIFNHHGDDYLVLKMFDFTFSKVKVDCLYFNKDALKPKKKLLRTTEKVFSLHVYYVLFFFLKFLSFTTTTLFGQFTHL